MEQVDDFRQRKDRRVSDENDADGGDNDEKRFEIACNFGRGGWRGEQRYPEIDEDEVLRELSQYGEEIFCCPLSTSGHSVVCIMLESYTTE